MKSGRHGHGERDKRRPSARMKIASSAVVGAIGPTVLNCYGVVAVARRELRRGRIATVDDRDFNHSIFLGLRDGTVMVDVYIIVEQGLRLADVAHDVIKRVGETVRAMLGDVPVYVSVNVQGLRVSA